MMKRNLLALLCGLLGILVMAVAIPPRVNGKSEISTEKLVIALRLLNTEEYSYCDETGRFADREQMLSYLRHKNELSLSPINLEDKKQYELAITLSADGKHYQIALKPAVDLNDRKTWCTRAAFSDDAAVIFLGSALDCEAQTP